MSPHTSQAPDQTPDSSLADAQWEAALLGQPLEGTPDSTLALAAAARTAMTELDTVRSPTSDEVKLAWQQVLQRRAQQPPPPSWWQRLVATFGAPRVLAPVVAAGLVAGLTLTVWRMQGADDLTEAGLRGGAATIVAPDADAATPAIVAELRALGLNPSFRRMAAGTYVEVTWPASPTEAQQRWLAALKLSTPVAGPLRLLLVKTKP